MAGILGNTKSNAQREVEARRIAAEEARADAEFGRNFLNRVGGIGRGLDTYAEGGLKDLIGNVSGFFGNEDFASRMGLESDELYRRGGEFFDQGLAGGNTYLNEKSIPLTREEEIIRQQQLDAAKSTLSEGEAEFLKNAGLLGQVDAGGNLSIQSGKPNISFTRKEGESKEDFKNRIIKEQSVTAGAPASSYDVVPSELTGQSASELQSTIDALTASGGKGRGQTNEQQGERAAFAKEQARKNDPMGDYSGEEPTVDLFMQAMADGNVAEGKEQPKAESREDMLEKYKQEFADATGIDISGKPDTSQALMAMGLGLMKNRAGKGFNVGKMLSAVGEAGEKAMPALSAARKEAKAARIAAGKYALGQIKADEDVESAIAASELAFQREYLLKEMEMRQKDREANYKDGEVKNPYNSEVMDGLNIRMGRSRDGAKYMDPSNALKKIAGTQRKVNGALETLDQMEVLLDDLGDANTGNAAKLIGDRVKTLMVAGGLTDAKVAFPETGISTEDELRAYQKSIVNEFKRFLTQETGNGISNVDIKNLEQLLGDVSVFTNPLTAKKRLSRIRRIFTGKRKSVAALRDNIMDPKYYATEQEFLDNQEKFDTLLSGNTTYRFVDDAGSLIDVEDK